MRHIVIVLLTVFATYPSLAQAYTGNQLLMSCQSRASDITPVPPACLYYVIGVIDGYRRGQIVTMIQAAGTSDASYNVEVMERITNTFCLPDQATNMQLALVARSFLEDYPARLHEPAILLVLTAIEQAFPCPATRPG